MARYKTEVTAYVLDHVDVVDLVGAYVPLKKSGRHHKGLCPFHSEKTPSFIVSEERGRFHCFGCGASGSAIQFVMDKENLEFLDALEFLADRYHLDLSEYRESEHKNERFDQKLMYDVMVQAARYYYQQLQNTPEAMAYFENRQVSTSIIKRFGLGYVPTGWDNTIKALKQQGVSYEVMEACGLVIKRDTGSGYYDRFRHRVMFPIFDHRGRVVAFGGRVLDDALPKYLNSPETSIFHKSNTLYGLHVARKTAREDKVAIVVEGYMDVVTLHQYGYRTAVASLGTALTSGQVKQLDRLFEEVVFAYDADEAGQNAIVRSLEVFRESGLKVKILDLQDAKDPDEYLKRYGKEKFDQQIRNALNTIDFSIMRIEKGYNLKDDEERLQYIKAVYEMIAELTSGAEREIYLRNIADRIGLSQQTLIEDFTDVYGHQEGEDQTQNKHHETGHLQTFDDTPLLIDAKLFKLEKAVLKCTLMSKVYYQTVDAFLTDPLYHQENHALFMEIAHYYTQHDTFTMSQAVDLFSLETLQALDDLMKENIAIAKTQDVEKILLMYQKLFLEAKIRMIDQALKRLKMTPGHEAEVLHREQMVRRIDLSKQLAQANKSFNR